jgi:hypothetical protein
LFLFAFSAIPQQAPLLHQPNIAIGRGMPLPLPSQNFQNRMPGASPFIPFPHANPPNYFQPSPPMQAPFGGPASGPGPLQPETNNWTAHGDPAIVGGTQAPLHHARQVLPICFPRDYQSNCGFEIRIEVLVPLVSTQWTQTLRLRHFILAWQIAGEVREVISY